MNNIFFAQNPDYGLPEIETGSIIVIQYEDTPTVKFRLKILDTGTSAITQKGIYYSKNSNPDSSDSVVTTSTGYVDGYYEFEVDGLDWYDIYYAKAFATNGSGTFVADEVNAKMPTLIPYMESCIQNITDETAEIGLVALKTFHSATYPSFSYEVKQYTIKIGTDPDPINNYDAIYHVGSEGTLNIIEYGSEPFYLPFSTIGRVDKLLPNTTYYYATEYVPNLPSYTGQYSYADMGIKSFTTLP